MFAFLDGVFFFEKWRGGGCRAGDCRYIYSKKKYVKKKNLP